MSLPLLLCTGSELQAVCKADYYCYLCVPVLSYKYQAVLPLLLLCTITATTVYYY
jgi:hypothetical protein